MLALFIGSSLLALCAIALTAYFVVGGNIGGVFSSISIALLGLILAFAIYRETLRR